MIKNRLNKLCGLVLHDIKDKNELFKLCLKYKIPITYPEVFIDDKIYYLWGISKDGVGLIGTIIMNCLEKSGDTIFTSINDLKEYLES